MTSWFFKLAPNTEGLEGLHPENNSLSGFFRSVLRKFKGQKSNNNSPTMTTTTQQQQHPFQADGAQSQGLIPVEGSVSSFRCGGMNFGAQAVQIDDENNNNNDNNNNTSSQSRQQQQEKQVTFNISCSSLESANHGVFVGLAPPNVRTDTAMMFDEPNVVMLSCATSGATLWSEHLQEYGSKVLMSSNNNKENQQQQQQQIQQCLFPLPLSLQKKEQQGGGQQLGEEEEQQKFVGRIQLKWNVESGMIQFAILNPFVEVRNPEKEKGLSVLSRQYFVKKSPYSHENSETTFASLLPTVTFSTVVNEDMVSLS